MSLIAHVIEEAHKIRSELLCYPEARRDLAGQCGIASMLIAAAVKDPHVLRTGFYWTRDRYGRSPNRHAWCQVDNTIVDITATQFHRRNKAVHVEVAPNKRYCELAAGAKAIMDVMDNWRGAQDPVYSALALTLRKHLPKRRQQEHR